MVSFNSKVIKFSLSKSEAKKEYMEVIEPTDVRLPDDVPARMKTLKADGKKWYLTVTLREDGSPFALFCHTNNKERGAQTSDAVLRLESLAFKKGILPEHIDKTISKISHDDNVSKLTRMISLNLRHGVSPLSVVSELDKMNDIYAGSFLFQIKKFLSGFIADGSKVDGVSCSNCGSNKVVFSEGCNTCLDCGSSKCG